MIQCSGGMEKWSQKNADAFSPKNIFCTISAKREPLRKTQRTSKAEGTREARGQKDCFPKRFSSLAKYEKSFRGPHGQRQGSFDWDVSCGCVRLSCGGYYQVNDEGFPVILGVTEGRREDKDPGAISCVSWKNKVSKEWGWSFRINAWVYTRSSVIPFPRPNGSAALILKELVENFSRRWICSPFETWKIRRFQAERKV